MSLSLLIEPYEIAFSKNPIYFQFSTTEPSLRAEIFIESFHYSNAFSKIITYDNLADEFGIVDLEIQDILNSQLKHVLPEYNIKHDLTIINSIKRYYIIVTEYDTDGNKVNTMVTTKKHVVLGGISHEEYPTAKFWETYLPQEKIILSWQNSNLAITPEQPYFINFICSDDYTTYGLWYDIKYYFDDNTTLTKAFQPTSSLPYKWQHYLLPVSLEAMQAKYTGTKTIVKYDVFFNSYDGSNFTQISETITINIDTTNYQFPNYFHYFNSLSGLDTLRTIGLTTSKYSNEAIQLEKSLKAIYKSQEGTSFQTNIYEIASYTTATGWLTKEALDHLRDMLISSSIFYIHKEQYIRILLKQSSITQKDDEFLYSMIIKYRYNFNNNVYTPKQLRLGAPETFYNLINSTDIKIINNQGNALLIKN
jgi:hypothetical protein